MGTEAIFGSTMSSGLIRHYKQNRCTKGSCIEGKVPVPVPTPPRRCRSALERDSQVEDPTWANGRNETIDIAVKAFELSQSLREKWFEADYAAKRRILQILCLNCSLNGASLVATMRKPFDLLAKGLVSKE